MVWLPSGASQGAAQATQQHRRKRARLADVNVATAIAALGVGSAAPRAQPAAPEAEAPSRLSLVEEQFARSIVRFIRLSPELCQRLVQFLTIARTSPHLLDHLDRLCATPSGDFTGTATGGQASALAHTPGGSTLAASLGLGAYASPAATPAPAAGGASTSGVLSQPGSSVAKGGQAAGQASALAHTPGGSTLAASLGLGAYASPAATPAPAAGGSAPASTRGAGRVEVLGLGASACFVSAAGADGLGLEHYGSSTATPVPGHGTPGAAEALDLLLQLQKEVHGNWAGPHPPLPSSLWPEDLLKAVQMCPTGGDVLPGVQQRVRVLKQCLRQLASETCSVRARCLLLYQEESGGLTDFEVMWGLKGQRGLVTAAKAALTALLEYYGSKQTPVCAAPTQVSSVAPKNLAKAAVESMAAAIAGGAATDAEGSEALILPEQSWRLLMRAAFLQGEAFVPALRSACTPGALRSAMARPRPAGSAVKQVRWSSSKSTIPTTLGEAHPGARQPWAARHPGDNATTSLHHGICMTPQQAAAPATRISSSTACPKPAALADDAARGPSSKHHPDSEAANGLSQQASGGVDPEESAQLAITASARPAPLSRQPARHGPLVEHSNLQWMALLADKWGEAAAKVCGPTGHSSSDSVTDVPGPAQALTLMAEHAGLCQDAVVAFVCCGLDRWASWLDDTFVLIVAHSVTVVPLVAEWLV
jgi:hypothetical protein